MNSGGAWSQSARVYRSTLTACFLAPFALILALLANGCVNQPAAAGHDEPGDNKGQGRSTANVNGEEHSGGQMLRGRVKTPGGRAFEVEIVQDDLSRQRGLQQRARLDENEGMLFVFPQAAPHRFWMYKCLIPLDIIWLDAGRKVVHIETGLPPCKALPCPDYGPSSSALYVLELGSGVAGRAGIRPGVHLEILFAEPPRPR